MPGRKNEDMQPMGVGKESSTSAAYGTDSPKPNDFLSCLCGNSTYLKENDVPAQDCKCYDRCCCLSPCCKGNRCLCFFSHRSLCVKRCCLPFLFVFLIFVGFFAAPRTIDIVLQEEKFKGQFDSSSEHYEPDYTSMSFDVVNKEVTFSTNVPFLATNYNWIYQVTFDTHLLIRYPAYLGVEGEVLGGAMDTMTIDPRAKCYLNMNCGDEEVGGHTWKDAEEYVYVWGKLKAESWDVVYGQLSNDCSACTGVAKSACTATTEVHLWVSLTPNEERMPWMNQAIGTVEIERVEEIGCKDVWPLVIP